MCVGHQVNIPFLVIEDGIEPAQDIIPASTTGTNMHPPAITPYTFWIPASLPN